MSLHRASVRGLFSNLGYCVDLKLKEGRTSLEPQGIKKLLLLNTGSLSFGDLTRQKVEWPELKSIEISMILPPGHIYFERSVSGHMRSHQGEHIL